MSSKFNLNRPTPHYLDSAHMAHMAHYVLHQQLHPHNLRHQPSALTQMQPLFPTVFNNLGGGGFGGC